MGSGGEIGWKMGAAGGNGSPVSAGASGTMTGGGGGASTRGGEETTTLSAGTRKHSRDLPF